MTGEYGGDGNATGRRQLIELNLDTIPGVHPPRFIGLQRLSMPSAE
jgi:hypothetical protein